MIKQSHLYLDGQLIRCCEDFRVKTHRHTLSHTQDLEATGEKYLYTYRTYNYVLNTLRSSQ